MVTDNQAQYSLIEMSIIAVVLSADEIIIFCALTIDNWILKICYEILSWIDWTIPIKLPRNIFYL